MRSHITLYADIVAFSLVLGSPERGQSPRLVGAMLSLHDDHECPLELDVDANPMQSRSGPTSSRGRRSFRTVA